MQDSSSVIKIRLFYVSNPSAAVCAAICASHEADSGVRDVLILNSDFYMGSDLDEYETVMRALAGSHDWDRAGFCNGISRTLEYAGRIEPFKSRSERIRADVRDARRTNECVHQLMVLDDEHGGKHEHVVSEIWADSPMYLVRFLFAKYRQAKRVLYPHSLAHFWGTSPPFYSPRLPKHRAANGTHGSSRSLRQMMRRYLGRIAPPAVSARLGELAFDKAYTFRGEHYLAAEVVDLRELLTKEALQKTFRCLPEDAQAYFTRLSLPDESGVRPSILFLPGTRGPQDFENEVAAFVHLLNATTALRQRGPVIVKPHPRGDNAYLYKMTEALQRHFPEIRFRLMEKWGTVPTEIAASQWDVTCCVGLLTFATSIMNWLFDVPAFCPPEILRRMYDGDVGWMHDLELFFESDSQFLSYV